MNSYNENSKEDDHGEVWVKAHLYEKSAEQRNRAEHEVIRLTEENGRLWGIITHLTRG